MNPEYKTPWLEALRGGQYSQGEGLLRGSGKHCCLGVLCDLANPLGWYNDDYSDEDRHLLGAENELGSEGRRLFGISAEEEKALIEMNDSGTPFAKIADFIEEAL